MFSPKNNKIQESFQQSHQQNQINEQEQDRMIFNQYSTGQDDDSNHIPVNQLNKLNNNINLIPVTSQNNIEKIQRQKQTPIHQSISEKQSYYQKAFENQMQEFETNHANLIQMDLSNIPQVNSKIVHQPIPSFNSHNQNQKNTEKKFSKVQMKPIPVQLLNQPQNPQYNNVILRNTISNASNIQPMNIQKANYQTNNNDFLRHSLPAQVQPKRIQAANTQDYNIQKASHRNQMPKQYPIVQPQHGQFQQGQQIKNQKIMVQDKHIINSNKFIPLDLLKNNETLEKSQIVYTNRQNNHVQPINKKVIQTQPIHRPSMYEQIVYVQPNIFKPKIYSQQPVRSTSRRSSKVIFNYNVHNQYVNTQYSQPKNISASPSPQIIHQNLPGIRQELSVERKVKQPVQIVNNEQNIIWKNRYHELYNHFSTLNGKLSILNEQYQKILISIQNQNTQNLIIQTNNFNQLIINIRKYSNSVINDWKIQNIKKEQKTRIQLKYKRLLFNYSKLQEQNQFIKAKFQQKINQIVKKLQNENTRLRTQIQALRVQKFNQIKPKAFQAFQVKQNKQVKQTTHNNNNNQLYEKLQKLRQQLNLRINERNQLSQQLNKYHLQNQSLKQQIQRLNQITSNMSQQLRLKNTQIKSLNQSNQKVIKKQTNNQKSIIVQKQINELTKQNQQLKIKVQQLTHINKRNEQYLAQYHKLQGKNTFLNQQLQRLNVQLKKFSLQSTSIKQLNLSKQIKLQYQFTMQILRNQIKRKQQQIQRQNKLSDQRINDLNQQLKISYHQRQNLHKKYEDKLQNLQKQKQRKQQIILQLKQKIINFGQIKKQNQIQLTRKNEYKSRVSTYNDTQQLFRYKDQIQMLKNQKDKIKRDYQQQINALQDQLTQYKQDNFRLKKQIQNYSNITNEIDNLNQIINRKNHQILQIKNLLFDREKIIIQNNNLKRQIDRLLNQQQRIIAQNQKINKNTFQLNKNIKQLQQRFLMSHNELNKLSNQYKLSIQAHQRKDSEIMKLRQNNQLLQTNINEIERQNQKYKNKLKNQQINFQQQKSRLIIQIQHLNQKINDFDKLIRQISTLQHKITQFQSLKTKYEYQLKQNDQLQTKQKNKIKNYQSDIEDLNAEIQTLNQKIKQSQSKNNQFVKKYKKMIEQLTEKNKTLQQKQIKFEKSKILQLQAQLKTKDNKIWKLEKQIQQFEQRLDQIGDQQLYGQKIITLQQKVKQYQSRLFNQTFKYSPTNYDYQATKVFQQKIIYELKQQNQKLKQIIKNKRQIKPTNDKNTNPMNSSRVKSQKKIKFAKSNQEVDQVENRLMAFNTRLQKLISPQNTERVNQFNKKDTDRISKISKVVSNQYHLDIQNGTRVQMQLSQLKVKYAELQRYCKNIEIQLLSSNTTKANQITSVNSISIQNDSINYHREKNRQLQERVQTLLKLNTQFKQNIDELIKRNEGGNSLASKQIISQLTQKNKTLQSKIKMILQQNQNLTSNLTNYQKLIEINEKKILDSQIKLMELQRQINQQALNKNSNQKDIISLKEKLTSKQQQISQLKSRLTLSSEKESSSIKNLQKQLQSYQIQFTKLSHKVKITQSQNQRLNQIFKKKNNEMTQQINRWRIKVTQLQQQINQILSNHESDKNGMTTMKFQISKLNQQIKSSYNQNQQLKQNYQNLLRKLQQTQNKYKEIQIRQRQLEGQLIIFKRNEEQIIVRSQLSQNQNAKLLTKIKFLQSQIERNREEFQQKIRNYQNQTKSIEGKIGLSQMEFLKLKTKLGTVEFQKQGLQGDLIKKINQISILNAQIERLNQEFIKKQKSFQQKILQLKNQLQTQTFGNQKQIYAQQIVRLTNQINNLNKKIPQFQKKTNQSNILIERLRKQNEQLKKYNQNFVYKFNLQQEQYNKTILALNSKIQSLIYYIEISRSIYLEIQALLDQKPYANQIQKGNIHDRVGNQIQKGLQIVSKINQIIIQTV